ITIEKLLRHFEETLAEDTSKSFLKFNNLTRILAYVLPFYEFSPVVNFNCIHLILSIDNRLQSKSIEFDSQLDNINLISNKFKDGSFDKIKACEEMITIICERMCIEHHQIGD